MNEITMLGKVRGLNTDQNEETWKKEIQIALSGQGEQLHAPSADTFQESARSGRMFWCCNLPAAPIASVTSVPTTAITLALYNNEPDGGRSYIINYVWANWITVTSITQVHMGIIGVLGLVREAIPTNSALVVKIANGMGKADTLARTIIPATALPAGTGIAANWAPIGDSINTSVVTLPGLAKYVPLEGRIIVPPGRYFGVHTLASINTVSAICGIGWTEKQLQLG